jgi:hypothetical protein
MQELSGSLATDEEMDAHKRAKEVHNLLFLWAVEKSLTTKVALGDPPGSELFDNNRCQAILEKLNLNQDRRSTSSRRKKAPPIRPGGSIQGRKGDGRRNKDPGHDHQGRNDPLPSSSWSRSRSPEETKSRHPGPGPNPVPEVGDSEQTCPMTRAWRWS